MQGTIEKIWENQTKGNKKYHVLEIGGEKYSVWDSKLMNGIDQGSVVKYGWTKSGDFRKITELEKLESGQELPPYTRDRKSMDIIRMSCLKSASEILYGLFADPDEKTQKAIDIAREFEKYVTSGGEDLKGNTGQE